MSVDNKKGAHWICQCKCGNIKTVSSYSLRGGLTKSCGCLNKEIISMPKTIDGMISKKFGRLTVIKRGKTHITAGGQKKVTWLCKCDCGNIVTVQSQDLKNGHTRSCGCLPTNRKNSGLIDLTGKRFGKLVVLKRVDDYVYKTKRGLTTSPSWLCKCDCGNVCIVQGGNLRNGATTHCGCSQITSKGEMQITNWLIKNNIKYSKEYSFNDLKGKGGKRLRFDFAILDDNSDVIILVEYQGEQHYIDCGEFGAYQRKYSDKIKKDYCKQHNLLLYEIRFDDNLEDIFVNLLDVIKEKKKKY